MPPFQEKMFVFGPKNPLPPPFDLCRPESGGGTVGYHAVKVSSHGKTRVQDNSQHPKSIYPLGSGDEGLRWILNLGTTPREYNLLSFAGMDFVVVFGFPR